MKKLILFLWQLPQNIAGLVVLLLFGVYSIDKVHPQLTDRIRKSCPEVNVRQVYLVRTKPAVSLGAFVFIPGTWFFEYYDNNREDALFRLLKHEHGHQRQSLMLGPLYLFVVGLPSIMQRALTATLVRMGRPRRQMGYYDRYPEKWADKLGGLKR